MAPNPQVSKAEESLVSQCDEAARVTAELSGITAEANLRDAQLERLLKDRDIAEYQRDTAVMNALSSQNQTEMARGVLVALKVGPAA